VFYGRQTSQNLVVNGFYLIRVYITGQKLRTTIPLSWGEHPDLVAVCLVLPSATFLAEWKNPGFRRPTLIIGEHFRVVLLDPSGRATSLDSAHASTQKAFDLDFLDPGQFSLGYYRHQRSWFYFTGSGAVTRPTKRESDALASLALPAHCPFLLLANPSVACLFPFVMADWRITLTGPCYSHIV